MRDTLSYGTKDRIKILGFYQLIGGIVGLFMGIKMLVNIGQLTGLTFLLVLIIFGLFSYSLYAGLLTIRLKEKWHLHSQVNQIIQFFNVSLLGYSYFYVSGLGLFFGFDITQTFLFKFHFYILSASNVAYSSSSDKIIIEFNVISICVLYFINKLDLRIKSEKEKSRSPEIIDSEYLT